MLYTSFCAYVNTLTLTLTLIYRVVVPPLASFFIAVKLFLFHAGRGLLFRDVPRPARDNTLNRPLLPQVFSNGPCVFGVGGARKRPRIIKLVHGRTRAPPTPNNLPETNFASQLM